MFPLKSYIEQEDSEGYLNELKITFEEINANPELKNIKVETDVGMLSRGRIIANLILNIPFNQFHLPVPDEFIIDYELNANLVNKHIDKVISRLYDTVDLSALGWSVNLVLKFISYVAPNLTVSMNISTSIKELFDVCDEKPELWDYLEWEIPAGLQYNEIEDLVASENKKMCALIESTTVGNYARQLRSGSVINTDQFRQSIMCISLKPDIMGNVIPEPINTSFLRGLRGYSDWYINCIGARKALITNYYTVKKAGYLARKFVLLQATNYIRTDVEDCNTQYGIYTTIQSPLHADMLEGRYAFIGDSDTAVKLTSDFSHDLVGQEILLRSPIRCACREGVCQVCYGQMSKANKKLHAGIYGSSQLSNQFLQKPLSSKHLLKTSSTAIEWPEFFQDVFTIDKGNITPDVVISKIIIDSDHIADPDDADNTKNLNIIKVVTTDKKEYTFELPITLNVLPTFFEHSTFNEESGMITYDVGNDPNELDILFSFIMQNNELSAAMASIFTLIEQEENDSPDDMYDEFVKRIINGGVGTMSINLEMIIRSLTRSLDNISLPPDYSKLHTDTAGNPVFPHEIILKLPDAILKSPSITNSLAFEKIGGQLMSPATYDKVQDSIFDILFS